MQYAGERARRLRKLHHGCALPQRLCGDVRRQADARAPPMRTASSINVDAAPRINGCVGCRTAVGANLIEQHLSGRTPFRATYSTRAPDAFTNGTHIATSSFTYCAKRIGV